MRQQLPPQIKKVELSSRDHGRTVIRYQVTTDVGTDPVTGKRRQSRKRYETEAEARQALADVQDKVHKGTYVHRRNETIEQVIERWLAGRTNITDSTLAGYRDYSRPVIDAYGDLPVQELTKHHIDVMLAQLEAGTLSKSDGTKRRPFKARARQYTLTTLRMVLESELEQGHLVRNVAKLVDMPSPERKAMQTFTAEQVTTLLKKTANNPLAIAWHLALTGLRRGEIAGLRWENVDLDAATMTINETRVSVSGKPQKRLPKTETSIRTLPLPTALMEALKQQQARQKTLEIVQGETYQASGYVVTDSRGQQVLPDRLSRGWSRACDTSGVPKIRLHDARHTCATIMHLQGVPIVVIAAWLGHVDAGFTMRTYAHNQPESLQLAAQSFAKL